MAELTRQEMLLISKFVLKARETINGIHLLLQNNGKQSLKTRNMTLMRGLTFVNKTKERRERFLASLKKNEDPEAFLMAASECSDKISRTLRGGGIEGLRYFAVVPGLPPFGPYATKQDAMSAQKTLYRDYGPQHK